MRRPWLIVAGDFAVTGGMDRANYALASRLATTGHEVHVVAHRVAAELRRSGVFVHDVPRPFGSHALGMPFLARSGWREAAAFASRNATVVTNGGNCLWPGVNWVHYVHAAYDPAADARPRSRVVRRAERRYVLDREKRALSAAQRVICNSERTRADCIEHLGIDPERTRVVYYGTDPTRFSAVSREERASARAALGVDEERPVAFFVGALGDRRKGFDALFEAWRVLCLDPAWRALLFVAGEGSERRLWMERAAREGLETRIRVLGFRQDVAALLAAADVLVHPARYEAYGLSVHEAICRGVPAVVSAQAGAAERLPPEYRPLLLDRIAADPIEAALRDWSCRREYYSELTAALGDAWRARTWDDMADDIVEAARRD